MSDRESAEYRRLFPNGVPLRGPLTGEQQRWLRPARPVFAEITRPMVDDPGVTIYATDDPDRFVAVVTA